MPKRKPGRDTFLIGDVLEWPEPDWYGKGKRKKAFFKKGERRVTAQVRTMDSKGYVHLEVLKCELVFDQSVTGVEIFRAGEIILRKHSTLKKREAKRIPWGGKDGEPARALAASKFVG